MHLFSARLPCALLPQDYYFSDWTAEERERGQHKSVMKCVLMTLRALHIHSALYWHSHAKDF